MNAQECLAGIKSLLAAYDGTPTTTTITTTTGPVLTPQTPSAYPVVNLGDMTSPSPRNNEIPGMEPNTVYCKRIDLLPLAGIVELKSGGLANFPLPDYTAWVSAAPGGDQLPFDGCAPESLMGANVSNAPINVAQLKAAGITAVYFNLLPRAGQGATGRYMQRNP